MSMLLQPHCYQATVCPIYISLFFSLSPPTYLLTKSTVGHKVCRKPNHTYLYLNTVTLHHAEQRNYLLSTLIHWAVIISDVDSLPEKLAHLRRVFMAYGYSSYESQQAIKRPGIGSTITKLRKGKNNNWW